MPHSLMNRSVPEGGKSVRVNVRTRVNASKIRHERRDGRDVIVLPSATLPDDVIMNGILYPAAEIEKGFKSLEGTPAPLGHPEVNGEFVSASDPRGIVRGFVGAWNENVRRENGRVYLDKVIDVAYAKQLEGGKTVLNAIEAEEPIHTSTGLYAMLQPLENNDDAQFTASDMVFDHDAILVGEEGAAKPEQGVGIFVNKAVMNGKQIDVINSAIDDAERDVDWAVEHLARSLERRQKAGALDRMKTAILEALGFSERETSTNEKENDMSVTDEQFKSLSDEVKTLSEGMSKISETIGNAVADAVKPLVDAQNEMAANQKAKDDAELEELRNKIVEASLMDEDAAKELTLNAARALVANAKPKKAAALNGAFNSDKQESSFKLPKAEA